MSPPWLLCCSPARDPQSGSPAGSRAPEGRSKPFEVVVAPEQAGPPWESAITEPNMVSGLLLNSGAVLASRVAYTSVDAPAQSSKFGGTWLRVEQQLDKARPLPPLPIATEHAAMYDDLPDADRDAPLAVDAVSQHLVVDAWRAVNRHRLMTPRALQGVNHSDYPHLYSMPEPLPLGAAIRNALAFVSTTARDKPACSPQRGSGRDTRCLDPR